MRLLEGTATRLRALEPEDIELLYRWENDPTIWGVSGTTAPFSRHTLERFIDEQTFDIYATRQLRLVIERKEHDKMASSAVGLIDLFEFDPDNRRAGVGILIHDFHERQHGYGADALEVLCTYVHEVLGLHQLWCNIGKSNTASKRLFQHVGFTLCGTKREWLRTATGWEDEEMWQKLWPI
jgi:diamine N-acetyltransferase